MAGVGRAKTSFRESAWGSRRSPSGSGHNLRGSARRPLPCAFARHPKLCAHCSRFPTAFRCEPRSAKCCGQCIRSRYCPALGSRLFPGCLQFSPTGLPRGSWSAAPALRWAGSAGAAFQMTTSRSLGSASVADWPRGRPRPGAPTPSLPPRADGLNTFSYLPATEDHTLRSALLTHPPAAGEGERAPLLFPGASRSV